METEVETAFLFRLWSLGIMGNQVEGEKSEHLYWDYIGVENAESNGREN